MNMPTAHMKRFIFNEKMRLCIIKHRANIFAVAEELSVPANLVQKYVEELKGKWSKDVSFHVASSIMSHLLLGHDSRVYHLQKCLEKLDGKEEIKVSSCCRFFYKEQKVKRWVKAFCLKCKKECFVELIDKANIYNLKFKVLEMLREEDTCLVNFAKNMGFMNPDTPISPTIKSQVLVVSNKDDDIIKSAGDLLPMDRERLRKQLQKVIIEGEVVESKKL